VERFSGIIGILLLLGLAYLCSENRKAISLRLVLSGLALQILFALLILKISWVTRFFALLGSGMSKLEQFASLLYLVV
jgi:CNT family concentrative nucleoside transporter